MRFEYPEYLFGLVLTTLVLALFYLWAGYRRRRTLEKMVNKDFIEELSQSYDPVKRAFKTFIIVVGVFFALLSLLRPQYGYHWEEVKRKGLDIIIALDTSKSMLAQDVKPNRLDRSKLAIIDLVKKLKGDRIGLIAFSGTSFLQCPLTVDYNGFLMSLDSINVDTIPYGGTKIANAIEDAISAFKTGAKNHKVLIFITDGEDHGRDPIKAVELAKSSGIRIFCIGIGSKEGELIPVKDEKGNVSFLKDKQGGVVKTKLDEDILKKIALGTNGSYIRATATEFGLDILYAEKISKLEKNEIDVKMKKRYEERYQIPLFIAFCLILAEICISDRKKIK